MAHILSLFVNLFSGQYSDYNNRHDVMFSRCDKIIDSKRKAPIRSFRCFQLCTVYIRSLKFLNTLKINQNTLLTFFCQFRQLSYHSFCKMNAPSFSHLSDFVHKHLLWNSLFHHSLQIDHTRLWHQLDLLHLLNIVLKILQQNILLIFLFLWIKLQVFLKGIEECVLRAWHFQKKLYNNYTVFPFFCQAFLISLPALGAEVIDLGTFGPVFSVEEENMIVSLKRKLQLLDEAGKLDDLKEQWKQKIKDNFKRPKPVAGIVNTTEARSFHHDPTLIIEHDIQTPKGDYLARKGDTLNPLLVMKPEKGFLFINGEDDTQIDFAKQHLEHFDVILVAGSPLDAERQLKVPVFFDQGGYLTTHYGIKQVPAFLIVDHNLLLVREVKP